MKAVIMAGGEGSRLRPLTSNTPKPMLPVVNVPMMEHIIRLCAQHGLTEIVVTVQYLANVIRNYFGDGSDFGVTLHYAVEEVPLGTAGSVGNARHILDESFLVISGDALTDIDLSAVIATHEAHKAPATIVLYEAENPLEFGIVITRDDGTVERFLEKPTWGQVFSDKVNTGIYVLEPEVFDHIPEGDNVDFSHDVFPALLAGGRPIQSHVADGYWEDVGTIEAYLKAHRDVLDGRVAVQVPGFKASEGVWLGTDCDVHPDAQIIGPAVIGDNCRIGPHAVLRDYTVLGNGVIVGEGAGIQRSVAFEHAYLGRNTQVRATIVGKGADLRDGARTEPDVVVGDGASIGRSAVLAEAVKVYPFKTVEDDAAVNTSVVWESRATTNLFGRNGVRGLTNVDVTPQLAVRLAMAYGSSLKRGTIVTTSRDASRACRAIKRAFVAGLNATGVHADDLEIATVPLTRFYSRQNGGGVTFRTADDDPNSIEIRFFAADGTDLSEGAQRKIERNFAREDFRRALADEMGEIFYPPRATEFYVNALLATVDAERIRNWRPKVVVDFAYGTASNLMPLVLDRLGVEVLALNPYTSERSSEPRVDASRLGDLVRASGSQFGIRFDAGAETATIVDDLGREIDPVKTLLTYVTLAAEAETGAKIVVPVSAPAEAERIAQAGGCEIVWSQTSAPALSEAAAAPDVVLAVGDRGLVWRRFQRGFDAVAQFVATLELLARQSERLSQVVDRLPAVHVMSDTVVTPWEKKGAVMRTLVESTQGERTVLIDGVKVLDVDGPGSWVLVLPDPEDAVCHIWAEARSDAAARSIVEEWRRRIRTVVG